MAKGTEVRAKRLTLRLPTSLHAAIKKAATSDRRSVSDWIVIQLEAAIARAKG